MNTFTKIIGTGRYIPSNEIPNHAFCKNQFYDPAGKPINKTSEEILQSFEKIGTGITSRRHVTDEHMASDIGHLAAKNALDSSGVDHESLDYLIVAHNFGDIRPDNRRQEQTPPIASKIKHKLEIENPKTVAIDFTFGCPGWLQGVILADSLIKTGAKRIMVVGTETLSRVSDPHDQSIRIYSDGAGAVILQAIESETPVGILCHGAQSDTKYDAYKLWMGTSNNPDYPDNDLFLKMNGDMLMKYAVSKVPILVQEVLDKANIPLERIKKVIIHQANERLDRGILDRLAYNYNRNKSEDEKICLDPNIMPMTIGWLGNSSVATIPTLLDLLLKGELEGHTVNSNDVILFASVGAGMNINAMVYRMP